MSKVNKILAVLSFFFLVNFWLLPASSAILRPSTSVSANFAKVHSPPARSGLDELGKKAAEPAELSAENDGVTDPIKDPVGADEAVEPVLLCSRIDPASRTIFTAKVSTYLFQSVLNL